MTSSSLIGALALLKELRDTTPITAQRKRIDAFLAINHDAQREISVIEELDRSMLSDNCPEKYIAGLSMAVQIVRNHFAATKPVSVDLEKCAEKYFSSIAGGMAWAWNNFSHEEKQAFKNTCKAVLDAAGVKHVD